MPVRTADNREQIIKKIKERQKLFKKALNGNADALIYLGKLYLGQSENGIKKNDRKK